VRDLTKEEMAALKYSNRIQTDLNALHKYEFSPYNSAYLLKKNAPHELQLDNSDLRDVHLVNEMFDKYTA
jgi:hypothetical protein